ncbi:MAG: class I SAM-dependent methyltransferase [Thermosynechococcaceae cyanobacterium]
MDTLTAKTQLFDRWAPSYDWLLPSVFYQAIHLRLLDYVQISESAHILDVGCGTGRLLNRLAQAYPQIQGTGLDLSPEMLEQARSSNRHGDQLRFVRGVSHTLPMENSQFEAVFSTISFLHYPNPLRVFAEVHRVLQPQGRFYLVDYTTPCGTLFPQSSVAKMQFYSTQERESMGLKSHLQCIGHHYLLGPVLLTTFVKDE